MPDETKSLEQLEILLKAADTTRAEAQNLREQIERFLAERRRADQPSGGDQFDRPEDTPTTAPTAINDLTFGAPVALLCGCSGKRWWERRGLVWVSIGRACPVHEWAMYDGLWVLPTLPIKTPAASTLQLGVRMVRHPDRPRIIVRPSPDGSTLAICKQAAQQRADDGTWRLGTLVEAGAMVASVLDAQLLAEHTAAIVQRHGPRGPIALVAPDDAQFEIATTLAHYSAAPAPKPFRTQPEAAVWLHTLGF